MSFLHVVVPHQSPSCCAKRRFSSDFPNELGAHIQPHEFVQSIESINRTYSKVHAGPAVLTGFAWLAYVAGLIMVVDPYLYTEVGDDYNFGYGADAMTYMWIGWGIVVVAIVGMISSARWMRNRRVNELNEVIAQANAVYTQRGVAWRVVNPGMRNMTIEISGLAPMPIMHQQPMQFPHQIQPNQMQPNQQYTQQMPMNYPPMQLNQVHAQNHYQPQFAHPTQQQVYTPTAHSINSPQPQYVHTAQNYPAVYPAEHANAPLLHHQ